MYGKLSEVLSSPAWRGSLSSRQVERFLKFRAIVFHLAIFLWHILLTYYTTWGVWVIMVTREDLVNKSCGRGIQYITVWSSIIQQTYFNACLLQDILEFTPKDRYLKLKAFLKQAIPYAFASFVLPLSFLVFLNFWPIYSVYPDIIDEDNVTATFFPNWVNHGLHTTAILLCCIEKFIVHRSYPTKLLGLAGLLSIILSYSATCCFLYVLSGFWPYPLFRVMSNIQRISYVVTNCILGFLIFVMGEAANKKIWSSRSKQEEKKKVS